MLFTDLGHLVGTLPTWLAVVGLVGLAWLVWRGQSGAAVSILQSSNQVLSDEVGKLKQQVKADQQQIAHLEAQRSLEPIVAAVVEQFSSHEDRAQERHIALLEFFRVTAEQGRERHEAMLAAYSQLGAAVTAGIRRASEGYAD